MPVRWVERKRPGNRPFFIALQPAPRRPAEGSERLVDRLGTVLVVDRALAAVLLAFLGSRCDRLGHGLARDHERAAAGVTRGRHQHHACIVIFKDVLTAISGAILLTAGTCLRSRFALAATPAGGAGLGGRRRQRDRPEAVVPTPLWTCRRCRRTATGYRRASAPARASNGILAGRATPFRHRQRDAAERAAQYDHHAGHPFPSCHHLLLAAHDAPPPCASALLRDSRSSAAL